MNTTEITASPHHITDEELALRFTFCKLRPGQAERFDAIWAGALDYARELKVLCPPSREFTDAIHALERVVYEANAAVARRLPAEVTS